jgi:hypothetical protein
LVLFLGVDPVDLYCCNYGGIVQTKQPRSY